MDGEEILCIFLEFFINDVERFCLYPLLALFFGWMNWKITFSIYLFGLYRPIQRFFLYILRKKLVFQYWSQRS